SVWKIMRAIEAGKTLTYGDVAKLLDSSPRAVGNACRRNPIPLLIPCHRIVAKNGTGGFAGQKSGPVFDIKCWLLDHETLKTI
ncbi:MAG: MGMT family protein, partial [Gammaproteobacteria bacterium]|nr:MGMT family protein [Gammaproteobacteria bacterium]